MSMADYATQFEELFKHHPHYNSIDVEGSKHVMFENGSSLEIKQFIGYHEIHHFSVLVNKFKIYDEDNRERSTHHKSMNENKFSNHNRGKPCAN